MANELLTACDCQDRDNGVIDVTTPLYQACGGKLYRLHVLGKAENISLANGENLEDRLNVLAKAVNSNLEIATHIRADGGLEADAAGTIAIDLGSMSNAKRKELLEDIKGNGLNANGNGKLEIAPAQIAGTGLKAEGAGLALDLAAGNGIAVSGKTVSAKIASGGGVKADGNGLSVDLAAGAGIAISGRTIAAKIASGTGISAGTNGIGLDILANGGLALNGGRLYVDFSALPASQIQSLVRGMAGSGLGADSSGKLYVDFNSMPDAQMRSIVLAMVQSGGGIAVDSAGRLYVDFNTMDTAKFEAMLKSIRVPIWLTGNKTFYVNCEGGSDTLDDKRGESAGKPFKTIQAAVNYICENYNVSRFVANIEIAAGVYSEALTLPEFSRNTGYIQLYHDANDRDSVLIQNRDPAVSSMAIQGGVWYLRGLTVENMADMSKVTRNGGFTSLVSVTNGKAYIRGCRFRFSPIGGAPVTNFSNYGLYADNGGEIHFDPIDVATAYETSQTASAIRSYAFTASTGGLIKAYGANVETVDPQIKLAGNFTVCAYASGGSMDFSSPRTYKVSITNSSATAGQRYSCLNGGTILCGSQTFFPGVSEGSVEAATYSWYK